jgi:iron(III) transport system substrate-binding protein
MSARLTAAGSLIGFGQHKSGEGKMNTQKKSLTSLVVILSITVEISSGFCADASSVEKAKEEGKLVFYAAMNAEDSGKVLKGFEKKFPQIKVELFRTGAPKMLQKILTERRAGKTFADVVLGFGYIHYELGQQGLLARFDSPERGAFSAQFKDNDGYWTNVFPIVHTIAYNTKLVAPTDLPARYADLVQPKWKGKAGMNSNNIMFLAAMLHFYGKEKGMDFLKKLAAQNPQVRAGGSLVVTLVAAGEFPIAFSINENGVERIKEQGGPVDWIRLADPLFGETVPIGIMAGAPHPNAARLFVDYVLSKEGQELFRDFGKVPARGDVEPKINIDRNNLRMIPPEEEAKTAFYATLFDNLFVKQR